MRMDDQRQSDNFRDRGSGGGLGGGGGGLPLMALFGFASRFGIGGIIVFALIVGGLMLFGNGGQMGLSGSGSGGQGSGQVCAAHADACTFSRQVLASTEDVWRTQFAEGRLPNYGRTPGAYSDPTLNVFSNQVSTGCGSAPSSVGPFYCPADSQLYIDPTFYETMARQLNAPGDFAQAYVIAHEVGHHIQNLIGANQMTVRGETQNQTSVRVELQADCLAGVWGHTAQASLSIDDADLREALTAAHSIGDDTLQGQSGGGVNPASFTHGTSAQRMRWFRAGFDSGDARQCDTFSVDQRQL